MDKGGKIGFGGIEIFYVEYNISLPLPPSLPPPYRMYYNHTMTDKGKIALRTAVIERDPNLCELKFAV